MESQMPVTHMQNATTQSNQPENTDYQDLLRSAPGTSLAWACKAKKIPANNSEESRPNFQKSLSTEAWKTAHLSRRQIMATGLFAAAIFGIGFGQ